MTTPSAALLSHRARHLATLVTPEPVVTNAPVPPAFTLQYEVMRDWQRHHPEDQAKFTELLAKFTREHAEVGAMQRTGADEVVTHARIDDFNATWDQMLAQMTEEPWASGDWSRVFAGSIAGMESRIAVRLGVDIARVYQLVEHALDSRHGPGGVDALIRDVSHGFTLDTSPLYSDETLRVLYEEASRVSETLESAFRSANPDQPLRKPLRRALAQGAGLPLSRQWFGDGPLAFELRDEREMEFENPAKYVPRYRRAIAWLDRLGPNLARLGDSTLKLALLDESEVLRRMMLNEVSTLPARLLACADQRTYNRSETRDWRAAMNLASIANWAQTLRQFHLAEVAEALAPAVEPSCAQLMHVPISPLAEAIIERANPGRVEVATPDPATD